MVLFGALEFGTALEGLFEEGEFVLEGLYCLGALGLNGLFYVLVVFDAACLAGRGKFVPFYFEHEGFKLPSQLGCSLRLFFSFTLQDT